MSRRRPSMPARTLRWLRDHAGLTEQPYGSNTDRRTDGIRAMQDLVAGGGTWLRGLAWCGIAACAAALHAGLKIPQPWRWASVAYIEDDARARTNGFVGWTRDPARVRKGDLAVLFGRGVHVETVVMVLRPLGIVITYGGNTSSGNAGSQNNGGGLYRRRRAIADVHGFARVAYPGRKA